MSSRSLSHLGSPARRREEPGAADGPRLHTLDGEVSYFPLRYDDAKHAAAAELALITIAVAMRGRGALARALAWLEPGRLQLLEPFFAKVERAFRRLVDVPWTTRIEARVIGCAVEPDCALELEESEAVVAHEVVEIRPGVSVLVALTMPDGAVPPPSVSDVDRAAVDLAAWLHAEASR